MDEAAALGWSREAKAAVFPLQAGKRGLEGFSLCQVSRVSDDFSLVLRSTHIHFQSHGS